ncbi:threonine/serine exporter family protein [Gottschalkiaceae bacterium SANA]|nr:threonine/serine exporter family protein [Gottschalkiaceae bacterium SANA]
MTTIIKTEQEKKKIMRVALFAGELTLRYGGETYRVEETIERMCRARGLMHVSPFAVPTGIFLSDDRLEGFSFIKRIKSRSIDLKRITELNDLVRKYCGGNYTEDEMLVNLKEIAKESSYQKWHVVAAAGVSAAFFALLAGGNERSFVVSLAMGMLIAFNRQMMIRKTLTTLMADGISGFLVAILAVFAQRLGLMSDLGPVIIGNMMPLVPGVAFTNGLRDLINGDLVSGITRVVEAILIAFAIALGVGIALQLLVGGGL